MAIIRSIHHDGSAHGRGMYWNLIGFWRGGKVVPLFGYFTMSYPILGLVFLTTIVGTVPSWSQEPIAWDFSNLERIGGHKITTVGAPRLIESPHGKAVEFDGTDDGLFVDANPLDGLSKFTAEVVFKPYAGGPTAQRFVHMQEDGSENRLLFEIRLTEDNHWFLDAFIKSGGGNYTLYAEKSPHAIGPWYHAAVVVDGTIMRHYVNGVEELSTPIKFEPQTAGRTSVGVRLNKVSWFKGAVRRLRITPSALAPSQFLQP
jgi:hypothetical protein